MFLYFDKQGVLKEIVNDEAIRQGNTHNDIYIYIEDDPVVSELYFRYRLPDVSDVHQPPLVQGSTVKIKIDEIPFNPKRKLEYFEYYKEYYMFKIDTTFTTSNGVTDTEWNVLTNEGNVSLGVRIDGDWLGLIVFNVEETNEGDNEIQETQYTSLAQFYYLLNQLDNYALISQLDDYVLKTEETKYYKHEVIPVNSTNPGNKIALYFITSDSDPYETWADVAANKDKVVGGTAVLKVGNDLLVGVITRVGATAPALVIQLEESQYIAPSINSAISDSTSEL